jgi:hypothetical protein
MSTVLASKNQQNNYELASHLFYLIEEHFINKIHTETKVKSKNNHIFNYYRPMYDGILVWVELEREQKVLEAH